MNRTVPPFKKPAFWVILAAAVCVVLGVLLLPHRSGPTQLGTSQAEPTVAYADGTAYAIQLDDKILIRSSSKKWTERDLPSTYIWIRADGSIDTLYMVPFAGETYPYPVIDCDEIQSVLSLPSGKGIIISTRKNGYYFHSQVDQVLPVPFFPSKDAFPYYPITVSPDEKQVISMNRAPGETGTSLYRYNVDTYQPAPPRRPGRHRLPHGLAGRQHPAGGQALRLRRSDPGQSTHLFTLRLYRSPGGNGTGRAGGLCGRRRQDADHPLCGPLC